MRKNPRRILSPQRLPFRHPGRGTTNLSNRTSSCNTSACVKPLPRCHKVPAMEMIFPLREWWPQSRASARKHRSSRRAGIRGARRFLPGALKRCPESLEGYLSSKSTWYRREHSAANKDFPVAYFSAEFGDRVPAHFCGRACRAGGRSLESLERPGTAGSFSCSPPGNFSEHRPPELHRQFQR